MDMLNIVANSDNKPEQYQPEMNVIVPSEGFCVKMRNSKQEKVFVNICHSDKVPEPRAITEDELRSILQDIEGSPPFRIPMSMGEAHVELDAAGKACTAYDVIIHPKFLKKVQSSDLFEAFLMTVIFEGLENKYGIQLERNWIVLKNKKSIGRLQEQCVRASSRPAIVELDSTVPSNVKMVQEVENTDLPKPKLIGEMPQYKLLAVPEHGATEYLVAQISLPKVLSSRGLSLDVASDMLRLTTRSQVYSMEVALHPRVDEDATTAEFNRNTKILTVTMPVQSVVEQ